jgi:hypothetical protein
MIKSQRKYAVGDKVAIAHDNYNAYPKSTIGKVVFCGCRSNGNWTYHVEFENRQILPRLLESELYKVD